MMEANNQTEENSQTEGNSQTEEGGVDLCLTSPPMDDGWGGSIYHSSIHSRLSQAAAWNGPQYSVWGDLSRAAAMAGAS